jgi:hypothetical protein
MPLIVTSALKPRQNTKKSSLRIPVSIEKAVIPSLSILAGFRVWGIPVEERRESIHGGLTSALPAADILVKHTPHPV